MFLYSQHWNAAAVMLLAGLPLVLGQAGRIALVALLIVEVLATGRLLVTVLSAQAI